MNESQVIRGCRWTAVALGLFFAWASRHSGNPDAICYLDLSDAVRDGHWAVLVNAVWCPVYPILMGVAARLLHPTPFYEFPTIHLINFFVYVAALASFEYLMAGLRARRAGQAGLPGPAWTALGYVFFVYGTLHL